MVRDVNYILFCFHCIFQNSFILAFFVILEIFKEKNVLKKMTVFFLLDVKSKYATIYKLVECIADIVYRSTQQLFHVGYY